MLPTFFITPLITSMFFLLRPSLSWGQNSIAMYTFSAFSANSALRPVGAAC